MEHTTELAEKVIGELTGQFGEMLRQWLHKIAEKETVTLGELEADVRSGLHSLGEEVLQGLVDVMGSGKTSAPVLCPQCREPMAFVRYQGKWVQTLLGTIRPERAYFHCVPCQQGHVPLDHQLGLGADSLSGGLEEALCLLAAHMPLEVVVDTLQRLLMVQIDDNTVQRTALRVGSVLVAQQEQRAEQAWRRSEPPKMEVDELPERLYIAVDGTTAHLQEGWKEVKVAAIYETESVPEPRGTLQIRAVRISYVVSFEDAQTFARYVYLEAARRGFHHAREIVVLGDGTEWIWNRIARFCDRPIEIVDYYHATEHVWNVGQALYREGTPATEEWVNQRQEELLKQGPDTLLASFRTAATEAPPEVRCVIDRETNYFVKHKQRMCYPQLRAAGYHIGSGSVESACKRIISARLKQAGMIWTRDGAQAMAQLRATILSNRWDPFWASYNRTTRTYQKAA